LSLISHPREIAGLILTAAGDRRRAEAARP